MINQGVLRARDGARLIFEHGTYLNAGAAIEALNGSFVDFAGNAAIAGGTLASAGTGVIRNLAGTNTLTDVTLVAGSRLSVEANTILHVTGTLTNDGRMELNSGTGPNVSILRVADNTTFAGSGRVVLGGAGNNHIQSIFGQSDNRLVNAAGHTIEGTGNIGGNNVKLTNQGVVLANDANPLVIDPSNDPDGFFNQGTVRVDATRTMTFVAGSTMVQDGSAARTEVHGTLNVPLLDLQAGLLTGTGAVVGPVQNTGGTVAPGASPGILSVGDFVQGALGTLAIELQNIDAHDLLLVNGAANLDGVLALSCFGPCSFAIGEEFAILEAGGSLDGIFGAGVKLSGFATGAFDVLYDYTLDEVRLKVTQTVTPVPEPEIWAMMLAGLALVSRSARRARQAMRT
jgi:hypothetical protein